MNKHIRADKKDHLSLRTEMTLNDIKTIRDVATGNVDTARLAAWAQNAVSPPPSQYAASILKEKMARESLYKIAVEVSWA
jgi:hypothetical protein